MKNFSVIVPWTFILASCAGFLDEKPSKDLVVPTSLVDLQAFLDNPVMVTAPGVTDIGTDDVLTSAAGLAAFANPVTEGNAYRWKEDILEGLSFSDWQASYGAILYANIVLAKLDGIPVTAANRTNWETIKGSALFYRSNMYLELLKTFSPQYDQALAGSLPGIPLRLEPEIQNVKRRETLEACYAQVESDLLEALSLLPELPVQYLTRPSKWAAYGLLARMSLQMGRYAAAADYARNCLDIREGLLDYSTLNPGTTYPIPQFNPEVVFHSSLNTYSYLFSTLVHIDPDLIGQYADGDLRKSILFRPAPAAERFNFRGNYTGGFAGFGGIALDEIYLILSESLVRAGNTREGLDVLNRLLVTRWVPGRFVPYAATSQDEALGYVLAERRKSLIFRGRRWDDLRRLNRDPRFQKTLERNLDGVRFSLPPNDNRYVYPIPQNELDFNPIEQNNRK